MSRKIVGALALALMLPLAACDDSTTVAEPGVMSLLLTDDPGDFGQAVVVIESIQLIGEGDPVMLREEADTTDLLTLSNDVEEMVAEATVPGGSYAQVRFIIPEACITVEQEDESFMVYSSDESFTECGTRDGELQLPSFEQTGIKVNLPEGATQVDGDQHVVVLDFSVEESFGQQAGGSGMWVMSPVITADEFDLTGSLTVTLTAAEGVDPALLGDFRARIEGEAEPVAFTDEDEDEVFKAEFLVMLPTDYEVYVELQDDAPAHEFTLDPTSPQVVTLGSGQDETVAFEVTSATAGS